MTINDQNMEKISELDFVKLNEILSNEQFANWYYSQFTSDTDVNIGIMEFIEIIKNYSDKSDDQ
jgi:transcription termination factor NusB